MVKHKIKTRLDENGRYYFLKALYPKKIFLGFNLIKGDVPEHLFFDIVDET
jgi:hypothetical protein